MICTLKVGQLGATFGVHRYVILIDERDARQAAQQLGLRVLGAIGILTWAKQSGRLSSLKATLDELREKGNFRISQELYERALSVVGEK
jgi:predicted nucleic acid-binding protein